jgi:sulfate/thiosulfate transport system substrate-binding protein
MMMTRKVAGTAVLAALALAGCGGSSTEGSAPAGAEGGNIRLVAYSTPREAYAKLIDLYRGGAGEGVSFQQSYGASGEQSRAVEAGLRADVVAFSLEPDMTRLVESGVVAKDWNAGEHKGMVTDSVVVFMVRKGNPKGIETWDDLTKDGVEVLTPNPFTSGGARWNVMAGYGAQLEQGKTPEQGREYLKQLFANVAVQDKSARESLTTFASGKGDVLLGYENEAIFAQREGQPLEYVVPDQTILIENPAAVTEDANGAAKGFLDFLTTDEAQKVYGEEGYRPVVKSVLDTFDFPTPPGLFTIADVGGWDTVQQEFFDRENGFMAQVQRDLGQPTD